MKTIKFLQAILLGAILLSLQSFAQDTQTLEYKFTKGNTYLYSTVSSNQGTQEMGGQEMKFSGSSWFTLRALVDDVKNGTPVLIVSAASAVTSSKSPMRDTTWVLAGHICIGPGVASRKSGDILS